MIINNVEYVIGKQDKFTHNGKNIVSIKARLPKGKNVIMITKYEDGSFSAPTRTHFKADF